MIVRIRFTGGGSSGMTLSAISPKIRAEAAIKSTPAISDSLMCHLGKAATKPPSTNGKPTMGNIAKAFESCISTYCPTRTIRTMYTKSVVAPKSECHAAVHAELFIGYPLGS